MNPLISNFSSLFNFPCSPLVNAGISNVAPIKPTEFPMLNPLSASTKSHGNKLLR